MSTDHTPYAQQPGKVLTDEDIDGIALMAVPPGTTSHDVRIAGQSIEESAHEAVRVYVRGALRYARDHYGIGAPAAGPSDERPWMNEWQRNMCKKSKGVLIRMIEEEREENDRLRNEAPAAGLTVEEAIEAIEDDIGSESMMRLFRARLTAAIEAKHAKP